ncbi:hypothetical protein DPMN_107738 [Dreissena polymorpha]|uniref:Uncharacterized protein n=1 Tax=Dreissena polymorpha TaxID=45954 RepID=A0A9D4K7J3_DREPO|nr:hypothetical protein DPMN_107738 [Dreissena polymorpha]
MLNYRFTFTVRAMINNRWTINAKFNYRFTVRAILNNSHVNMAIPVEVNSNGYSHLQVNMIATLTVSLLNYRFTIRALLNYKETVNSLQKDICYRLTIYSDSYAHLQLAQLQYGFTTRAMLNPRLRLAVRAMLNYR